MFLLRVISRWDLVSAEIPSRRRFSKPTLTSSTGSAEPIGFTKQPKRELIDCAGCFCSKLTARIRVLIVAIVSTPALGLKHFRGIGCISFFPAHRRSATQDDGSVEYDYGKFIVVAGLASRDRWPPWSLVRSGEQSRRRTARAWNDVVANKSLRGTYSWSTAPQCYHSRECGRNTDNNSGRQRPEGRRT
jgi:hypothetical protein